ncbi:MAG: hypothetical protein IPQ13_02655 [Holophagaceae bacterium]|nr:hypothetical protein [Holophagaceae bacterium]
MKIPVVLFLALPLMACGGGELAPHAHKGRATLGRLQSDHATAAKPAFKPTLALSPKTVALAPGATQSFSAQINYEPDGPRFPRQPVSWSVVEAGGGEITRTGLYTAPAAAGTYHVRAEREDHPGVSDTATVTVAAKGEPGSPKQ